MYGRRRRGSCSRSGLRISCCRLVSNMGGTDVADSRLFCGFYHVSVLYCSLLVVERVGGDEEQFLDAMERF